MPLNYPFIPSFLPLLSSPNLPPNPELVRRHWRAAAATVASTATGSGSGCNMLKISYFLIMHHADSYILINTLNLEYYN